LIDFHDDFRQPVPPAHSPQRATQDRLSRNRTAPKKDFLIFCFGPVR
jgi:hypothetical protein